MISDKAFQKWLDLTDEDYTPYIVAEVGSNWRTKEDVLACIEHARDCQADAVKFQLISHERLFGFANVPNKFATIDLEWLPEMRQLADLMEIDLMISAFEWGGFQEVNEFVDVHKIASSNCHDMELIRRVSHLGKPFFVSVGGMDNRQVLRLCRNLEGLRNRSSVVLYCDPTYPSVAHDPTVVSLWQKWAPTQKFGFSDHSKDVVFAPKMAANKLGCIVIEKHFNPLEIESLDSGHSLNCREFKAMVNAIWRDDHGSCDYDGDFNENVRTAAIAVREILPGEPFKRFENFEFYRPTLMNSTDLTELIRDSDELEGCVAAHRILAGQYLHLGMLAKWVKG